MRHRPLWTVRVWAAADVDPNNWYNCGSFETNGGIDTAIGEGRKAAKYLIAGVTCWDLAEFSVYAGRDYAAIPAHKESFGA